ncbi:MAG: prephenate dehydrogenase/arogenate dehydrogenase family protein [Bacillota bacterium]
MTFTSVAIIGLGLIGGSLGAALRKAHPGLPVRGYDRDPRAREIAAARGLATVLNTPSETLRGANLVILAIPVDELAGVAGEMTTMTPEDAVVTDTGSVKAQVVPVMEAVFGSRYVGGHPLAGTERSGPAAAHPDLFRGTNYAITPTARTTPQATGCLCALVEAVGAQPVFVSPGEHDHLVAYTSHVPYLVSVALAAATAGIPGAGELVAGGWRDATRVAAGSPGLYASILAANGQAVLEALDVFCQELASLRQALKLGRGTLAARIEPAQAFRERLAAKRGWL